MKSWLAPAVVAMMVGFNGMVRALEPSAQTPPETAAQAMILIDHDQLLPQQLYVPKGKSVHLLVYNNRESEGGVELPGQPETLVVKPRTLEEVTLSGLREGKNDLSFTCRRTQMKLSGKIIVGLPPADQTVEAVLLAKRRQFEPNVTPLPENQPVTLVLFSTISLPHADFVLFGTDIKLPFKKGKIMTVEIPKGLQAGTYLISRPKYPQQKHHITSRLEVSSKQFEE